MLLRGASTIRGAPERLVVFQNVVNHVLYLNPSAAVFCIVSSGLHFGRVL